MVITVRYMAKENALELLFYYSNYIYHMLVKGIFFNVYLFVMYNFLNNLINVISSHAMPTFHCKHVLLIIYNLNNL